MNTKKTNPLAELDLSINPAQETVKDAENRDTATTPDKNVGKNDKEAIKMSNNQMLPQNEIAEVSKVTKTKSPGKDSSEKGILDLKTCDEYRKYLESGNKSMRASGKYPPKDALSLHDLGLKPIGEIRDLTNKMSVTPNKSDLLVMYANGFSFSWAEMQTAAEVLGLKKDADNTNSPKFYIPDNYEVLQALLFNHKKTIYIEHGKRPSTVERKITLSKGTNDILNSLFGSLPNLVQSKILDVLVREILEEVENLNEKGLLDVKYRPLPEETIEVGSVHKDTDK